MSDLRLTGGCNCGAVRFDEVSEPLRLCELLSLSTVSATDRCRGLGQRTSRAGQLPDRCRPRSTTPLEAAGRRREVVLRRLRLGDVRAQSQSSRFDWDPDGHVRPRSGNPAERPTVRRARRPVGTHSGRRTASIPREPPRAEIDQLALCEQQPSRDAPVDCWFSSIAAVRAVPCSDTCVSKRR